MIGAGDPDAAFVAYRREVDLLESAARTGAPAADVHSEFFGLPADDFRRVLRDQRDRVEASSYFAIVAATEGILQLDWRARAHGKRTVPLRKAARAVFDEAVRRDDRVTIEEILDAWKTASAVTKGAVSQFKQLLKHRHFLAHGSYFSRHAPAVPVDPGFAIARYRALYAALQVIDPEFPR